MFYTYIYLDPRKPGLYQYGDYTFEYEPFYVGKGNGSRYKRHLECLLNENYDSYFYRKIKKIKKETNENPIFFKIEENLSDREALDLEVWLIWAIGRYDKRVGPLTNLTDGGDGPSNPSIETRMKLSKINMGHVVTFETRQKISNSLRGKIQSLETRQKNSEAKMGIKNSFYGKHHTPETIEKLRKPKSLETRQKMSKPKKRKLI